LNGGFQGSRGLAFAAPYVEAIKRDVGMLVGLQLAPEPAFARITSPRVCTSSSPGS
jgi:hypothetical protein